MKNRIKIWNRIVSVSGIIAVVILLLEIIGIIHGYNLIVEPTYKPLAITTRLPVTLTVILTIYCLKFPLSDHWYTRLLKAVSVILVAAYVILAISSGEEYYKYFLGIGN